MEETTPSVLLYYNGKKQLQVYFYTTFNGRNNTKCTFITIMEETTPSVLLYYNGKNNTKCTFLYNTKCTFIL